MVETIVGWYSRWGADSETVASERWCEMNVDIHSMTLPWVQ